MTLHEIKFLIPDETKSFSAKFNIAQNINTINNIGKELVTINNDKFLDIWKEIGGFKTKIQAIVDESCCLFLQ
jgi:hypothetical protein